MPVSILPALLGIAAIAALLSLCLLVVALKKKHRPMLWIALAILCVSAGAGYASYTRLERIHSELFASNVTVKTRQALLDYFGPPSRHESYIDHGREIDVLFYDITLLQPPVHTQFQFYKEEWVATIATNR